MSVTPTPPVHPVCACVLVYAKPVRKRQVAVLVSRRDLEGAIAELNKYLAMYVR